MSGVVDVSVLQAVGGEVLADAHSIVRRLQRVAHEGKPVILDDRGVGAAERLGDAPRICIRPSSAMQNYHELAARRRRARKRGQRALPPRGRAAVHLGARGDACDRTHAPARDELRARRS